MGRSSGCGRKAYSTPAPTSAAIRLWKPPSRRPRFRTNAPKRFCASWPGCTRKIRAPISGRLCRDRHMRKTMGKGKSKGSYMISSVAEQYAIHPQTLRLYEREGLLKPSRSDGNTRLYTDGDLERLEVILHLTRELGVNLAGVEIILNMREKMSEMQAQIEQFVTTLNRELVARRRPPSTHEKQSLVRVVNYSNVAPVAPTRKGRSQGQAG